MRRWLVALLLVVSTSAYAQVTISPAPIYSGGAVTSPILAPTTPVDCSAPQYSFQGDTNTGVGYLAADAFSLCAGGGAIHVRNGVLDISNNAALFRMGVSVDVVLARDTANVLGQRNGVAAQNFRVYNQFASGTDWENIALDWQTVANVAMVGTRTGSAGTSRALSLVSQATGAGDGYAMIRLQRGASPILRQGVFTGALSPENLATTGNMFQFGEIVSIATSGSTAIFAITPTYNQAAATTANTDLLINRTQTAVGSGQQNLIDAQVGGVSKFRVDNNGTVLPAFYDLVSGGNYRVRNSQALISNTAPTIGSGFGTSPSIVANNGTATFTINVGTGGTASAGVVTLPAATTGWNCYVENRTGVLANVANQRTVQTATTTTSATFENQTISTGAVLAWTASDVLAVICMGY